MSNQQNYQYYSSNATPEPKNILKRGYQSKLKAKATNKLANSGNFTSRGFQGHLTAENSYQKDFNRTFQCRRPRKSCNKIKYKVIKNSKRHHKGIKLIRTSLNLAVTSWSTKEFSRFATKQRVNKEKSKVSLFSKIKAHSKSINKSNFCLAKFGERSSISNISHQDEQRPLKGASTNVFEDEADISEGLPELHDSPDPKLKINKSEKYEPYNKTNRSYGKSDAIENSIERITRDEPSVKITEGLSDTGSLYFKTASNAISREKEITTNVTETDRRHSTRMYSKLKQLREKALLGFLPDQQLMFVLRSNSETFSKYINLADLFHRNQEINSPPSKTRAIDSKGVIGGKKIDLSCSNSNDKNNSKTECVSHSEEQKGQDILNLPYNSDQNASVDKRSRKASCKANDSLKTPEYNILTKKMSRKAPLLGSNKKSPGLVALDMTQINQNSSEELSPSDQIQIPLPSMTCSKRLNHVKSSLNFSHAVEQSQNGGEYLLGLSHSKPTVKKCHSIRKKNQNCSLGMKNSKSFKNFKLGLMLSARVFKPERKRYNDHKEDLHLQIKQLKDQLIEKNQVNSNLSSELDQLRTENSELREYVNDLLIHEIHQL
ncbi:unnamed protein product [Moneuplotes crassus]|uniref:Uncharacterized protein n=1 Tax=Euplotes crassus TaxID=5936 RepID=A0AAD1Y7W9_EUPCR|nr:unnamed protein product [Moneuplotes crassus]